MEARYAHTYDLRGRGIASRFKGEAVVVDVGDRGTLFVLVTGARGCLDERFAPTYSHGPDPQHVPSELFDLQVHLARNVRWLHLLRGAVEVPLNRMPLMVRFDEITDPVTVSRVDPCDLAANFGEGVLLGPVTMETTRDEVTVGTEDRLTWLAQPHPPGTLARGLIYGDAIPIHEISGVLRSFFRRGTGQ